MLASSHMNKRYSMKSTHKFLVLFLTCNAQSQGLMFSHKYMQQINEGAFEWPQPLYFAVDLKAPGQRVRILRNKTFCSFER